MSALKIEDCIFYGAEETIFIVGGFGGKPFDYEKFFPNTMIAGTYVSVCDLHTEEGRKYTAKIIMEEFDRKTVKWFFKTIEVKFHYEFSKYLP